MKTPVPECLFDKVVGLKLKAATLLKETLAQVFSCEFCKISKNTFSYRTPPVAASGCMLITSALLAVVLRN